jgi:ABC-type molybdate transport system substrate-binding protein
VMCSLAPAVAAGPSAIAVFAAASLKNALDAVDVAWSRT